MPPRVTIPLFTVTFMRFYARERWRTIGLVTLTMLGVVDVFFIQILSVPVYGGLLLDGVMP